MQVTFNILIVNLQVWLQFENESVDQYWILSSLITTKPKRYNISHLYDRSFPLDCFVEWCTFQDIFMANCSEQYYVDENCRVMSAFLAWCHYV